MKSLDGSRPVTPIDEVVPLRDEVAERAAFMAEGNPAVHAAGALCPRLVLAEWLVDLAPVSKAHRHGPTLGELAVELQESGGLTHVRPP